MDESTLLRDDAVDRCARVTDDLVSYVNPGLAEFVGAMDGLYRMIGVNLLGTVAVVTILPAKRISLHEM